MARHINRNDVYDYVASTLPHASFDSDTEYNIDGIVDTVIASIPDLIGEHDATGAAAVNVAVLIDSMIEDEDAYWQVVADHRINDTDAHVKAAVLAQLQRELGRAYDVIAHANAKAAAAERIAEKLRAEYDRIAAGTDLL